MPAHHYSAPGGVARVVPLVASNDQARSELLDLLADLGPLMLEVSRSIDRDPSGALKPLRSMRDRVARSLSVLR